MDEVIFKDTKTLVKWLHNRGVPKEKAERAAHKLLAAEYDMPSTLLNASYEQFVEIEIPNPIARLLSNKLDEKKYQSSLQSLTRQVTEQLIISPDKRKFTVNGSIDRTSRSKYFYIETTSSNEELYAKIHAGDYVTLHGPRAVGKSTRMLQACDDLSLKFHCMNVSLHDIEVANPQDFWESLSQSLVNKYASVGEAIKVVKTGPQFTQLWHSLRSEKKCVLFIDEFDALQSHQETVDAVLSTFRGLKQSRAYHKLHSVIIVGVFSIVSLNTRTVSPFNVSEQVVAPFLDQSQVQKMFDIYSECRGYSVEVDVIKDIYERTGGHAGLVNLCGKAIDEEIRRFSDKEKLTLQTWLSALRHRLQYWLRDFPTTKRLVDDLKQEDTLQTSCRKALSDFFLCRDKDVPEGLLENPMREYLLSVGMILESKPGMLRLANSMVRMLAIWEVVPVDRRKTISEALPMTKDGVLDAYRMLVSSTSYFPADELHRAKELSFKNAGRGSPAPVPHEYYYQSQLASIIRAWLPKNWVFFPEVKTIGDRRRIDFVIENLLDGTDDAKGRFVLELEATSSNTELKEHYDRADGYGKMIDAGHVWVVHFCAVPLNPVDLPTPKNGCNIHVLHLVHSRVDSGFSWTAHYCPPGKVNYKTESLFQNLVESS